MIKKFRRRQIGWLVFLLTLIIHVGCSTKDSGGLKIRSWTILTKNKMKALQVIEKASEYDINQLQLSHDVLMNLRQVRDTAKLSLINYLTDQAHQHGIEEVVLWDHSLYGLDYYPAKFKTGPDSTIDFDNSAFWEWFSDDYRTMLDKVPNVQGLVLTFIETGARAEDQHSIKMKTHQEKIAAVVDAVTQVVINERHLKLYLRTFSYTHKEYENVIGALEHVKSNDVVLMMKESPHDFFLTHPNNPYVGKIDRPTIVEFDCGNEFSGQGVIANTWPEYIARRWKDYLQRPNVIGYAARTDRYGDTGVIGRPSEILLYALKRFGQDATLSVDSITIEFIGKRYGKESVQFLKPAFESAYDIVTSTLYTLGTNVANHSSLNFDPYPSSYGRHVSGKWIDPPVLYVKHGVDLELHYWKEIIQHLAPAVLKMNDGPLTIEAPFVLTNEWVSAEEKMDTTWYTYIITEKEYGVALAKKALAQIQAAKPYVTGEDYEDLHETFYRTLITAQLYEAMAKAYWGYRVYARGKAYQSVALNRSIKEGLDDILIYVNKIKEYPHEYPRGQWNWKNDVKIAEQYYNWIAVEGWKEYGGVVFKE